MSQRTKHEKGHILSIQAVKSKLNFYSLSKARKMDADMSSTEEHVYTNKQQQDMITQENTIDSTESMSKLPQQPKISSNYFVKEFYR